MSEADKLKSEVQEDNATEDTGDFIQWSCHPLKRRPWVSVAATLFVLFVIAVVYNTTDSAGFGLLAFVIFFLSLARFYFPTRYRLSDKGVTVKTTTHMVKKPWSEFRSFYPDKNGVLLSPFAQPSRLENFRGVYIMFDNNNAEVTSFINDQITRSVGVTQDGEKD